MKKVVNLLFALLVLSGSVIGQLLNWTPDFSKDNDNIVITVDATKGNQGLNGYTNLTDVYVHTGVITNLSTGPTDWKYSKFTWATTPALAQATSIGGNKWQYTISNIRAFFGVPTSETILRIAILFRNGAGTIVQRNADGGDMYIPVYDNSLATRFTLPLFQPTYNRLPEPINKQLGDNISLTAIANQSSTMKLFLNGTEIQSASNATTISANPVLTTAGNQTVRVDAINGTLTRSESFQFFIAPPVNIAPLPSGVRDGINYETGNTSVVLVLYAPGKARVSVIGEFAGSNWQEQTSFVMNKTPDGNYWWLRIAGLNPGQEYAFQYLADGTIRTGDPYSEKILDPFNDGSIPASTYPGLKPYPTGLTTGNVSVLQTAQPVYNWTVNNFSRPDKRNLVIYELLMRDFIAAHDWNTLRDTLSYLKTLGVNAIEIMPFSEFDANESWGYNPAYFLAPDKYYGTKGALKQFIDTCHRNGIAVIMDIALNHTTGASPLAALYWNSAAGQPAANNPWLNTTATHPFSVFNDFNHESPATKYFTSRVVEHWLQEYKLDGFRFDLSKGFTQNVSGSNVSAWSQYDASRVNIWKRYYDTCQQKSPGSYVILEHFAENSEEIELSNYGMLLWGNNTYNFQQAAKGFVGNSNFENYLHTARSWTNPYLISYMESHDEERIMYENITNGNSSNSSYNIKNFSTAIKRVELCGAFFLTAPGPKMIWQFGELGYDYSINRCTNGSISSNCRLDKKPIQWDYKQDMQRKRLYDVFSAINKLRQHPLYKDVFIANNTTITRSLTGAFKTLILRSATDSSCLVVVGNFDVTAQSAAVTFPVPGTWYNYVNGGAVTIPASGQNFNLQPGEYHIYINRNITNPLLTAVGNTPGTSNAFGASVFPNPVTSSSLLEINIPETGFINGHITSINGQSERIILSQRMIRGTHRIELAGKLSGLRAGVYILTVEGVNRKSNIKIIVQ